MDREDNGRSSGLLFARVTLSLAAGGLAGAGALAALGEPWSSGAPLLAAAAGLCAVVGLAAYVLRRPPTSDGSTSAAADPGRQRGSETLSGRAEAGGADAAPLDSPAILHVRELLRQLPEMALTTDSDLRITFVNNRLREHLPPCDPLGEELTLLFDVEDRERLRAALEKLERGEAVRSEQLRLRCVLGPGLPVLLTAAPVGSGGDTEGFAALLRDRRQAEHAAAQVRDRERVINALFQSAPVGMVMVDVQSGRVAEANRAAQRLIGAPADKLEGSSYGRWFEPAAGLSPPRSGHISAPGSEPRLERTLTDSSGKERPVICRSVPVEVDGRAFRVECLVDLSDQRGAERKYRALFEHLAEPALLLDAESGRIREVNAQVHRLLGHSVAELVDQPFPKLHPPERAQEYEALFGRLRDERVEEEQDLELVTASGERIPCALRLTWLEVDGRTCCLALVRDIRSQRRAQQAMRRAKDLAEAASRAKSEFVANVSHEIRTPLNAVLGMTRLLLDSPLSGEQREHVDLALRAGDNLLALITDLLDFSRMEAGELPLSARAFDLAELVERSLELVAPRAEAKGLELQHSLDDDLPRCAVADPQRIRQVLLNLVDNAIKFTERGGITVRISRGAALEGHEQTLRVTVTDTGPGVAESVRERLFEAFAQGDASAAREHGGAGLGLAISRRLVERMGGQIGVAPAPGGGAAFWFTAGVGACPLPRGPSPVPTHRKSAGAVVTPAHLLVVEDDPTSRLLAQRILSKLGYTSDAVVGGIDALKALREGSYDAVLLDVQMPGLDGIATARRVRAGDGGERACDIPIVALTAHALSGDRERCLEAGMDSYLAKPVDPEALAAMLAGLLSER